MSNARNLARLIVDSGGDVEVSSLGNVPPSNDASALTTGTLPVGRLPSSGVDASSLTTGSLGSARLPAGSVLQTAQARKTDSSWSVNTTYFQKVTGLSVTMTPTATSSRFLVTVSVAVGTNWWQTDGGWFGVHANDTLIAGDGSNKWLLQYGADSTNTNYEMVLFNEEVLYAPNTTSPITFDVSVSAGNASYPLYVNRRVINDARRGSSWITVKEIAG
jgi:hypothetical protein